MMRCQLSPWTALLALGLLGAAGLMAQERKEPVPPPKAQDPELAKAVGAPVDPRTYVIGAEDVLLIRVWREPELTGPVAVRPDGKITLPLIGEVQAAGITPEKLTATVAEGYSKFVTSPEVIISVQQVNSKKYFISGEVNRPGSYPLVVPTRVLEALAIAGGFRDFADTKNILIMRGAKRYKFNYKEVVRAKNLLQNILLESGDHIIVP